MSENAIVKVSKYFESDVVRARFRDVLGSGNAGAYISSVLLAVADSDALQKCTLASIYSSALRAATLRLSVDPSTGQAYLVPFSDKATLIVGYKGLHDMAVRTGKYRYINVAPIHEGEVVVEDRISGFHKITGGKTSPAIVGWLAAFELYAGYGHTMFMAVDEIHEHAKKYSKSYNNPKSGWKTDTEKMERKTVLRLLLRRWGYLDPADSAALDEIEKDSDIIEGELVDPDPEPTSEETKAAEEKQAALNSKLDQALGFAPEPEQPEEPEPAMAESETMTLDQARSTKTEKGIEIGMLNHGQLEAVAQKNTDPIVRAAAVLVLNDWDKNAEAG